MFSVVGVDEGQWDFGQGAEGEWGVDDLMGEEGREGGIDGRSYGFPESDIHIFLKLV